MGQQSTLATAWNFLSLHQYLSMLVQFQLQIKKSALAL
jgi:hypothetical protein